MKNLLVISIKPEFMKLILSGVKSIELRKCRPSMPKEEIIIALYCTSPVKAIVGFCLLEDLIEDNPKSFWNRFSANVGVDKTTFFEYYHNTGRAFGLQLQNICVLNKSISLDIIREEIPNFSPPQTYRYYNLEKVEKKFRNKLHKEYQGLKSLIIA